MSISDLMDILRATAVSRSRAKLFINAMVIVMSGISQSACSASDTFEIIEKCYFGKGESQAGSPRG